MGGRSPRLHGVAGGAPEGAAGFAPDRVGGTDDAGRGRTVGGTAPAGPRIPAGVTDSAKSGSAALRSAAAVPGAGEGGVGWCIGGLPLCSVRLGRNGAVGGGSAGRVWCGAVSRPDRAFRHSGERSGRPPGHARGVVAGPARVRAASRLPHPITGTR
ncbi:hypothetical protein GCM10022384_06470 [Streptomyces marokkonensis]|uniref:Uncharacterized protein n=1 Tax=Streptomyces marokkonensis TaxID=324855 RepID=A0ABP7NY60_9ACTN